MKAYGFDDFPSNRPWIRMEWLLPVPKPGNRLSNGRRIRRVKWVDVMNNRMINCHWRSMEYKLASNVRAYERWGGYWLVELARA